MCHGGDDEVPQRLLVSVSEAAELLGLGRTKTWALVRAGELRSVRVGKRVLVPVRELERFVRELQGKAAGGGQ